MKIENFAISGAGVAAIYFYVADKPLHALGMLLVAILIQLFILERTIKEKQ